MSHADLAPEPPLLTSDAVRRDPPLGLRVEYFEVGPGAIPETSDDRHLIAVPLMDGPADIRLTRAGHGHRLTMTPGEIALAPAGMPTAWAWSVPISVALLWIEPRALAAFARDRAMLDVDATPFRTAHRMRADRIAGLAADLVDILRRGGPLAPILYDATAELLYGYMLRDQAARIDRLDGGPLSPAALRRIDDHLRGRLGQRIPVTDLADLVGLSPSAFNRAMRERTGRTPAAYVSRARLDAARREIGDTARPLAEIAARCGFADQAHMTRAFRKAFGATPGEHRAARKDR